MITFGDAPELATICNHLGAGVNAVNRAVVVLRDGHAGDARLLDAIDVSYAPEVVQRFQDAAREASQAFGDAQGAANAWYNELSAALSQNLVHQHEVEQQQRSDTEDLAVSRQKLSAAEAEKTQLQAQLAQDAINLANAIHAVDAAEGRLDDARSARNAAVVASVFLFFVAPVVALPALAIGLPALESAVDGAKDSRNRIEAQLASTRQALQITEQTTVECHAQVSRMESRIAELGCRLAALEFRRRDLTTMRDWLVHVRPMVLDCVHTVDTALASATTLDNMLSLSNVSSAVRSLSSTLNVESFRGLLPVVDGTCLVELEQQRARLAQKAAHLLV
ncbi:hypothetical protein AURDEDRAFT_173022 [Auricularia subglabra TFB-10046 SS5]|uniref:Uncharacterized protein n=1 Tax=Auricularia subglabra (strain TFB-10046 / SS5) TaxID=717982 RepID=J0LHY8_AURST|nr:hypothetical protein AURDEDRAFT_173022 [Auricularia subglabra TFB-10046 SS5]